jgi:hypothetical protein
MAEHLSAPIAIADASPGTPQRRAQAVRIVCDTSDLSPEERDDALILFSENVGFVDVFISAPDSVHIRMLKRKLQTSN